MVDIDRPGAPQTTRVTFGLRLLGGFGLHSDDVSIVVPEGGQRLLALLAIQGSTCRAEAAGRLWPRASEDRAHGNLRSAMWRLHRLWPGIVESQGRSVALCAEVPTDLHALRARVTGLLHDGPTPEHHALGHDNGIPELLPGWYDPWVLDERDRLRQLCLQALDVVSQYELERGHFGAALDAAFSAIHTEPLRESSHRAAMRVHLAQGNVIDAVHHFDRLKQLLEDELGVRPSPMTRDLLHLVRRRVAVVDAPADLVGSSWTAATTRHSRHAELEPARPS
jgi:DNA-binding SARP family transcriptional activator